MFGILDSLTELAKDTAKLAAAPVKLAIDLTDAVVKPVADTATEWAEDVANLVKRD